MFQLLCSFFVLLSLLAFLRPPRSITLSSFAVSSGLVSIAALCKETAFLLLPFQVLLECLFLRRKNFAAACAAFAALLSALLHFRISASSGLAFQIDAEFNPLVSLKLLSPEWIRAVGYAHRDVFSLLFDIFRADYCFDRAPSQSELLGSPRGDLKTAAMYGSFLALIAACSPSGRDFFRKMTITCAAFFVLFYLPASQILFNNGFFVAERTLYIPSSLLSFFAASCLCSLARRTGRRERASFFAFFLLVTFMAGRAHIAAANWKDRFTLYSSALSKGRPSFNSYRGLGQHYYAAGDLGERRAGGKEGGR